MPPPARLALLDPRHLSQPDWPAYTDDFLLPPYAPAEMLARLSLLGFRKRHIRSGDTPAAGRISSSSCRRHAPVTGADAMLPLTPARVRAAAVFSTAPGQVLRP